MALRSHCFSSAKPVVALRVQFHGTREQRFGRVDAGGADAGALHDATEAPLAAANVERIAEAAPFDPRSHRRVQHEAATIVAVFTLLDDPSSRGRGPAVADILVHGSTFGNGRWPHAFRARLLTTDWIRVEHEVACASH